MPHRYSFHQIVAIAITIIFICLLAQCTPKTTTDPTSSKASVPNGHITEQDNAPQEVWIDADLAVGMTNYGSPGYSDVDDGYAILQLLHHPAIHITGISSVYGNTRIDDSYRLCQEMVATFGNYEIPVFKGAGEPINLRSLTSNDGVEAMARSLMIKPQKILAIGPATNVGILLLQYPELRDSIQEVILVAGRRTERDFFAIGNGDTRFRDLNFDLDNTAFQVLLESGVPIALCPFEISSKVWLKAQDLDTLSKGTAGSQWLANKSRPWLAQWYDMGADGFNPFDVLASHYLIRPQDIISETLNARLVIHSDDTVGEDQQEVFKNYLLCTEEDGYPVTYCYDVVPNFHNNLISTFVK